MLSDHLGSVDTITDETGTNTLTGNQQFSFGAWGKRRSAGIVPLGALTDIHTALLAQAVKLGFTGHEHDDEVGLINMKGRLYDANLGRFISADPHVQAPKDTQSFNRYTYVKNNPLSYTDPSGYFFKKLFKKIKRFLKKYGRAILAIAAAVVTAGATLYAMAGTAAFGTQTLAAIYATSGFGAAFGAAVVSGAAGGFASGLISTGSLRGALEGAVFGGLSAGFAFGIGHGGTGFGSLFSTKTGTAIAHGVSQGTVSVLRGAKFKEGFAGGFFGHISGGIAQGIASGASTVARGIRTVTATVIGGTISKMVGGKFANGAVSAAFTHLFNYESKIDGRQFRGGGSTIVREGTKGAAFTDAGNRQSRTPFERLRRVLFGQAPGSISFGALTVDGATIRLTTSRFFGGIGLMVKHNSSGGCNEYGWCYSDVYINPDVGPPHPHSVEGYILRKD